MIVGYIYTYTREAGLTKPYCAQIWTTEGKCVITDTFVTSQDAFDFCQSHEAETIHCEIYGQD